jgi:hypothetical protein
MLAYELVDDVEDMLAYVYRGDHGDHGEHEDYVSSVSSALLHTTYPQYHVLLRTTTYYYP